MSVQLWLAKSSFSGLRREFYEDLAEALEDDAPLVDEIEKLALRAKAEHDVVAPIYRLWLRRMDDRSFAQSLGGTVPNSDVMILEASEAAGSLADGLRFLARAISATNEMTGALRKAVTGFLAAFIVLVSMLFAFSFYGIGIIEQVVPPNAWPWIGQCLRDTARFVTGYSVWLLSGMALTGSLFIWSLPNWTGKGRSFADRYLPMYSIYRDFHGAIFLVSLAALMRNGVGLAEALEKLRTRATPWMRWHIRRILMKMDYESAQPAKAFDTGIFNKRLTWRLIDFGARPNRSFPAAIGKVGLDSLDKVTLSVTNSAKKLNSFLLIMNGLMMAFIITGTMLTMYEAQNAVQKQISTSTPK